MKEQSTSTESESIVCYETMEAHARGRHQNWLQVMVGAVASGEKVLLACAAGQRESKESWLSVLRDLKARG